MGKFILYAALALNLSSYVHADDHVVQLGEIKGDHLGLFYSDHAFSGHVKETLTFATIPADGDSFLKLQYWIRGQHFESNLVREGKLTKAVLPYVDANDQPLQTEFVVTEINHTNASFSGTIGKKSFLAKVSAQKMEGQHFVDPRFDVTVDGKDYAFRLEKGMACMGCSLKILYVVLGMLEVTGAL